MGRKTVVDGTGIDAMKTMRTGFNEQVFKRLEQVCVRNGVPEWLPRHIQCRNTPDGRTGSTSLCDPFSFATNQRAMAAFLP